MPLCAAVEDDNDSPETGYVGSTVLPVLDTGILAVTTERCGAEVQLSLTKAMAMGGHLWTSENKRLINEYIKRWAEAPAAKALEVAAD